MLPLVQKSSLFTKREQSGELNRKPAKCAICGGLTNRQPFEYAEDAMRDNGKEADTMSAKVIPISSHPRYSRPLDDRSPTTKAVDAYYAGGIAKAGGNYVPDPAPPPPPPPPPHDTESSVYISCAETAKLLRVALKNAFPGVKFGVRSKTYSGGASITVVAPAGVDYEAVKKVTGMFSGAGFDGMNDLKFYYTHWMLPDGTVSVAGSTGSGAGYERFSNHKPHPDAKKVHFGADFIFVHRPDGCLA